MHLFPVIAILTLATTSGTMAVPFVDLARRQVPDILVAALSGYSSAEFKSIFGVKDPGCENYFQDDPKHVHKAAGKGNAKYAYSVCYVPGDTKWREAESNVTLCLADKLFNQKGTKCVSVKGSDCEDGYNGRIQNAQYSWLTDDLPTQDQASSMISVIRGFVGYHDFRSDRDGDSVYTPVFSLIGESGENILSLWVNYIGEPDC
ncbi:hypothetical protein N7492_002852 [Penicillium capsulatum]|uniref:Ecp2 effector protein domain-containing protein n=1 Tax=Penicillium capsulatum TaxID=69766 RepID=A0A9W9IKR9_9EURO|nr:hypothetical protein N7492_002852 [Penicillium capsulatum]KAJ6122551.1 hypothetical protein N7512_005016 [Penicillium capsulatum]